MSERTQGEGQKTEESVNLAHKNIPLAKPKNPISASQYNMLVEAINRSSQATATTKQKIGKKITPEYVNKIFECTVAGDYVSADFTAQLIDDTGGNLDGIDKTLEKMASDYIDIGDRVLKRKLKDGTQVYMKFEKALYIVDASVPKTATTVNVKKNPSGAVITVDKLTSQLLYKGDHVVLLKNEDNKDIAVRVMDFGQGADILTTKVLTGSGAIADTEDWKREPLGGGLSEPMSFRTYRIYYDATTGQLQQFYRTVEVDVNGLIKKVSEETKQVITTAVDCP